MTLLQAGVPWIALESAGEERVIAWFVMLQEKQSDFFKSMGV